MEWIVGFLAIFFFFKWLSLRSAAKEANAHLVVNAASPWLTEVGFDVDTVRFATYCGRPYALLDDAVVLVGTGANSAGGERVAFAVEISARMGCMPGKIVEPATLASLHKTVAQKSFSTGIPLLSLFEAMMREHKKQEEKKANDEAEQSVERLRVLCEQAKQRELEQPPDLFEPAHVDSIEEASAKRVAALRLRLDREAKSL